MAQSNKKFSALLTIRVLSPIVKSDYVTVDYLVGDVAQPRGRGHMRMDQW
jgi:hypothetical protein